jgi:mycoredoxin
LQGQEVIKVYATTWCGDCRMAKHVLDERQVDYEYIDIDLAPEAASLVQEINGGFRTVPTILFPDGRVLVEPSRVELEAALVA